MIAYPLDLAALASFYVWSLIFCAAVILLVNWQAKRP